LYDHRYVAANDGNVSVRLSPDLILATPTGMSKGFIRAEQLVKVDMSGELVEGDHQPSTEIKMHTMIYSIRPDIHAVVHAHPIYATGFATAQIPLDKCVLAEIIATLGSIPLAPYATPSTTELPDSIKTVMSQADACLLANHGVVTAGKNVYDAYYKMERVEHFAHISFVARVLGGEKILSQGDVEKLYGIRSKYGTIDSANPGCYVNGDPVLPSEENHASDESCKNDNGDLTNLVKRVISELNLKP
jgi:L-fuculose-phosphate aldolase